MQRYLYENGINCIVILFKPLQELLQLNASERINFDYNKLPISCCYFFEDGTKVSLPSGSDAVAEVLSNELGENRSKVLKFLERLEKNYNAVYPVFIKNNSKK